jgi:hypothetical protein
VQHALDLHVLHIGEGGEDFLRNVPALHRLPDDSVLA